MFTPHRFRSEYSVAEGASGGAPRHARGTVASREGPVGVTQRLWHFGLPALPPGTPTPGGESGKNTAGHASGRDASSFFAAMSGVRCNPAGADSTSMTFRGAEHAPAEAPAEAPRGELGRRLRGDGASPAGNGPHR